MISKVRKGESLLSLNREIVDFLFFLINPMKFYIFYRKFDEIFNIIKYTETLTKNSSSENADKEIIKAENVTTFIIALLAFFYVTDTYVAVKEMPSEFFNFFWSLMLHCLWMVSAFASDYVNTLLEICFFEFCLQICSLLNQFEEKLLDLNQTQEEKHLKKKLKDIVESHEKILQTFKDFVNYFNLIISINFVVSIWFIGQGLIFTLLGEWYDLLTITPFMVFDAWIICYATQLVITKVKKKV